jgi:hypothetical protein
LTKGIWNLITYAEKAGEDDYPNIWHDLEEELIPSLVKVRKMFPDEEFSICIRNIDVEDNEMDLAIYRNEDGQAIAEMEFIPE